MNSTQPSKPKWSWWYLLLAIQFLLVLWPPLYNRVEPSWAGIPFFYWYQLACVIAGAVLTAIVYFATESRRIAQDASAVTKAGQPREGR